MLNVPQIEGLRQTNPQLYESLKRLAGASLGPNQGWSLDDQVTDGSNYSRVVSGALTEGKVDPTKSGVLMKGSVPPTWSGTFTYLSTTSSIAWSWTGLSIYRADGSITPIPDGSLAITGLSAGTTYYFYPYWDDTAAESIGSREERALPRAHKLQKLILPRSNKRSKDTSRFLKGPS